MVLQLLALWGACPYKGTTSVDQVLALQVEVLINQEILLLRSYRGHHTLHITSPKEFQNPDGLTAYDFHGTKQWGFLVQYFSAIRAERSRDTECILLDKCITGRVPSSIPTRLEGCPEATGRERRCIRLSLDQLLSTELHKGSTFRGRNKKLSCFSAVMLVMG